MARAAHPKKEIESALKHAERCGWRVVVGASHAWGRLYCAFNDAACRLGELCMVSIWGTPRDIVGHARFLRRVVDHCTGGNRSGRWDLNLP